jgi:hypothetical protein
MVDLPPDVEQALRDLPENEWTTLQARLRPPDSAEQLRTAVAQYVPESQLDSIMGIVKASAFLDDSGQVDEAKVDEHFGRLFGADEPQPPRNWGQGSRPGGPPSNPGDTARAALAKRHGVAGNNDEPAPGQHIRTGAAGRAAAAKRHGVKQR